MKYFMPASLFRTRYDVKRYLFPEQGTMFGAVNVRGTEPARKTRTPRSFASITKETTMDRTFQQAALINADTLSQRIEQEIPNAKVTNLGWLVLVRFENGSVFTLAPLTDSTCDLNGTDCHDQKHERDEISWDDALKLLQGVDTNAQPVQEIGKPFGNDPLGGKERSQGRTLNESGSVHSGTKAEIQESTLPRMLYGSELFKYLKDVLPVAEHEAFIDDAGNFIVAVDPVRVRVMPKGANLYDVETFVRDKREPQQVQLSHAETIRYVFELVSTAQSVNVTPARADDEGEENDPADSYEVLRELAGELGKPTDHFRNPALFSLRAGLVTEEKHRTPATNELLSGLDNHLQKFETLKHKAPMTNEAPPKPKWFRGHPVAINGDMHGKTLAYVQGVGSVLVDTKDIPPSDGMKLSWDDKAGVVMVPESQPTKRPSWHFKGWNH
jgi:hypothetical protein